MSKIILILFGMLAAIGSFSAVIAQETADPYADIPKSRTADGAFVLGNPDAPVKLIEFSDFLCTSCQNYETIIQHYIEKYVLTGEAQLEYRMFPVIDPVLSSLSASLVECTDSLSTVSFWRAHDLMFEMVMANGFTLQSTTTFAQLVNLEEPALLECASAAQQYSIDQQVGLRMGVQGTPSLFVQFGDAAAVAIPTLISEQFETLVNAARPDSFEPVVIETGPYVGLTTFRRADGGFVLGSSDAPLTIVAFEDFLCPHCHDYQETVHLFIEQHVRTGKAQFEYRFYPLVNPQFSVQTAQIAECVGNQDLSKFWEAHDLLYEFAKALQIGDNSATALANLLDLDGDALDVCRDRAAQYLIDTHLGQQAGVSGTPAVRARLAQGALEVIFSGQQPITGGGVDLEVLAALVNGSPQVSIGAPEISLLNDAWLSDTSLVTAEPCEPPCWQNITPGLTSSADALDILNAADSITVIQYADSGMVFGSDTGVPCCQIVLDDGGMVSAMVLQFAPNMLLGDVIGKYGDPSFVTGQPVSGKEAALILVYPERGLFVYAAVTKADGLLKEISPIVSAIFATPTETVQLLQDTPLDNWKGYLTYDEYMDGEFDNTP